MPPPLPPWLWQQGGTSDVRVALKPASGVGLIWVGDEVLEQISDCFSAADRSTGNPAFPIP